MSTAERLPLRQQHAPPIREQLRTCLETSMNDALRTDVISEARNHILHLWLGLPAYLSDGEVPIDNNLCEQLMKHGALDRKNWLYVRSLASGYRTATLLTIVSCAVRNDLDAAFVEDISQQLLARNRDFETLRTEH